MGHWTYAGEAVPSGPSRRYLRPNGQDARLRVSARGRMVAARPALSRPLRLVLITSLVVICLGALNRGPALHAELAALADRAWDQARAVFGSGPQLPAAQPAASRRLAAGAKPAAFTPVAMLADGGIFGVGADGRVQPCQTEWLKQGLVVISGCQVREVPEPMGIVLKTEVPMDTVRKIMKSPLHQELSEIAFGRPAEIVLYTREAVKIRLRPGPQLDQDLLRLAAVWEDARSRKLDPAVIDLRFAPQIVVRPRNRR